MTANYHPVPTLAHEPPLSSSFSYPPSPFTHVLLPSLPLLLPHLSVPPFPSLETFPPILSCPIFPTSVSHERTHTVAVTDVDARVHANAYTLTRALSRQYRKLKDWAMIARGPAWPFHPSPSPSAANHPVSRLSASFETLPAIYRTGSATTDRGKKREKAFVLLSENYRIGREK